MKLLAKDLKLDEAEVELLRAVDQDVHNFEPSGESEEALTAFQVKANIIRKLDGVV